jgi:hypothetical protein
MPKSTYLDNNFLNAALRNTPYTPPVSVHLALYLIAPGVGGGGTEVSGAGYSRQPVTFSAPVGGQCSNTADINFPVALADWGTVTAFGLLDNSSGGNLLYFGNLSSPRFIAASDQAKFPTGQLVTQES